MTMHARRRLVLAVAAMATQAGCGFRLRESTELPFRTLYVEMDLSSSLATEFSRQARQGTTLVASPEEAEAIIRGVREQRTKEAVSFSRSGRPREYELRYSVQFNVQASDGSPLLDPSEIMIRRYITTTDLEQLSEELEEAFLYSEMESDMVQQILRRLAVITPNAK